MLRMSFDLQPILKGELLGLRPLRPEDFNDLCAVASDPLIWEQHPIKDRYKEEVFKGFFREALESGGALIAIDSKDGQVIGSSRFHGYDKEKSEIEIGWTFLARSHWGGIYNREMKQLMLRHGLQIREQRYLSCWSTEFALAEGHGKNRRSSCGIKARRGWPRKFCLPNHAFNVPRHPRATIGLANMSHRCHRRWVMGSGAEALVRSFRLH